MTQNSTWACIVLVLVASSARGQTVFEDAKLVGSGASGSDEFGRSVSIDGDTALVGAENDGTGGTAYVFGRTGSVWTERIILSAPDAALNDRFGVSVALDGDTAVIGASGDDTTLGFNSGSAYVFVRSGTSWALEQKLTASDGIINDRFGIAVSVSGDTLLIGAHRADISGQMGAGAAYVFVRSGTAWTEQAKLTASPPASMENFGERLDICGDTAVVGLPRDDEVGSDTGTVYAFVRSGTSWALQAKLQASTPSNSDRLGTSVAIDGDTIVAGAHAPFGIGYALVFVRTGTSWAEDAELQASDGVAGDLFGRCVSVDGDTVVVSATVASDSGCAYVFVNSGSAWSEQVKLCPSDGADEDRFGEGCSIRDGWVLVGAYLDDDDGSNSGSAYAFALVDPFPPFCDASDGSLTSCPCTNPGLPETGCDVQQATGGVLLSILGQETTPQNRVTMLGTGFPAMGLPTVTVVRGPSLDPARPVVFGDGLRCVGLPVVRLAATAAVGGTSLHTFGHGAMAAAGSFHYQLYFRNTPAMFCTPDAFNLSNGRTLAW